MTMKNAERWSVNLEWKNSTNWIKWWTTRHNQKGHCEERGSATENMKRHGLSKKMHWFGTYMYAEYFHSTSTRTLNSTKYTCASITFCHVIDTVPAPSARNSNQNFSNVLQHEWGKKPLLYAMYQTIRWSTFKIYTINEQIMHKVELHTSSHYNAWALTHLHLKKPMADNRNNEKNKTSTRVQCQCWHTIHLPSLLHDFPPIPASISFPRCHIKSFHSNSKESCNLHEK